MYKSHPSFITDFWETATLRPERYPGTSEEGIEPAGRHRLLGVKGDSVKMEKKKEGRDA